MKKTKTSEFGYGFVYNLVLFAKHAFMYTNFRNEWEKVREKSKDKLSVSPEEHGASLFFYGATDHLFDLEIPERYKNTKIERKVVELLSFCHARRLLYRGNGEKDFQKVFEILDEILFLIDKDLGIKDIKATWE